MVLTVSLGVVFTMCVNQESMEIDLCIIFFFQAEDGIRDVLGSRGLGDVYKRQDYRGISV